MRKYVTGVLLLLLFLFPIGAEEGDLENVADMTFEELLNVEVVSASLKAEKLTDAPSNIMVITKEMMENRGYRSFVEIAEDIPGFDFLIYEDGAGEFSTFAISRGIGGDPGASKILVMVDGIPQNFINVNWSTLWTFANLLHDLDRIEIIQGPGSATYGAQAYGGTIHFISKSRFQGMYAKIEYGSNNSRDIKFHFGKKVGEDFYFSAAGRLYHSDGDGGTDRYDPGGYFHGNIAPYTLTQHYDPEGNYATDYPNPIGGQAIPDGFNNWVDALSLRIKLSFKNSELGFFYWDDDRASSSYIAGHEYYLTDPDHKSHQRGYHAYLKNSWDITHQLSLESNVVYRASMALPDTSAQYTFRFEGMAKAFYSFSNQSYVEERLNLNLKNNSNILLGVRLMASIKPARTVTLNSNGDPNNSTAASSWDIAVAGGGLNKTKDVAHINVLESATYALWNQNISASLSTSIGARFDNSTEFGSTLNPRLAVIYKPTDNWTIKGLYGSAFRQPSIFELMDFLPEGETLNDVSPEKIKTFEVEVNSRLDGNLNLRTNFFYSILSDEIRLVPEPSVYYGVRYANSGKLWVRGVSVVGDFSPVKDLRIYANYIFTQGKNDVESIWADIDRIAKNKLNFGFNWFLFNKINVNFRGNMVGKRKAPITNKWLHTYEGGYAPGYMKANMAVTLRNFMKNNRLEAQLVIRNLFDKQFYGVGRMTGSSFIDEYDPETNYNPSGYIPSYHPQPGRTIMFALKYKL
ncbi:MAG: TonB-dependent receptor [bacterium]|nr:TonB-dependent receptor [bacterium]